MPRHYLLDENKNPYEVSLEEGLKVYEDMSMKIVQQDRLDNGVFVSTVFLGLDHSWSDSLNHEPVLFETMIFEGPYDQYQVRYTTYNNALNGHKQALELVKKSKKE